MNRVAGLVVAAVLVGGFGIGAWMYFEGYFGTGDRDTESVPVVEPLPEPIRQRPEDPGGYQADSRGSALLEGTEPDAGPERLLPSFEEPVARPRVEPAEPPSEAVPDAEAAAAQDVAEEPAAQEAAEEPAAAAEERPKLPEPRHPRSAWKASVQLLAIRSRDRAVVEAQRLLAAHPDVFGNLDFRVREFKVSEQERVQRLQAGPFETRKDAGEVCNRLEKRGVPCFVAKGQ